MSYLDQCKTQLLNDFVKAVTGGSLKSGHVFSFEHLQSQKIIDVADKFRKDIKKVYGSDKVRSSLDSNYKTDQKPALNLLKQILRQHGYKLVRASEYQGRINNKKTYESYYQIEKK